MRCYPKTPLLLKEEKDLHLNLLRLCKLDTSEDSTELNRQIAEKKERVRNCLNQLMVNQYGRTFLPLLVVTRQIDQTTLIETGSQGLIEGFTNLKNWP